MRKRNCRETMTSVPRRKKRAPPPPPPPPAPPVRRRSAHGGAPSRVRSRTGGPLPEGGDGEGRAGARSFDPSALLRPLPRGGGRRIPHRPDANRRPPAPPFPIRRVPWGGDRAGGRRGEIRFAPHGTSSRVGLVAFLFFSFLFVATTASSRRASAAGVAFVAIRRPRRAAGNDRGSGGLTSVDRDLNGRSATHSTTFRFESSTGDLGAHRGT